MWKGGLNRNQTMMQTRIGNIEWKNEKFKMITFNLGIEEANSKNTRSNF